MDEAYNRARQILSDHIDALHQVAAILIEKETIEAVDFYRIMSKYPSASTAMAEAAAAALKDAAEEQADDNKPDTKMIGNRRLDLKVNIANPESAPETKEVGQNDPDIRISFGKQKNSEQDKN